MRYHLIYLFFSLFLISHITSAQYYDTGEDPASLKWMQIKTDRFKVIYPKTYGPGGITYAKALENAYSKLGSLYPQKKQKIPVIIHNYTIESNGYVSWAPRRMEIYPTPEQNTIPLSTEVQLSVHELSHVLQMQSLNKGFTRGVSLLLGEQAIGLVSAMIPLWFYEGDAVFSESALTDYGRGNSPSFQKQLKAIAVEKGGLFKYDKSLNGSFKEYIPSHYQTGYQMVTWARTKYDPEIWNKVLRFTGSEPFVLNPVNLSLKKNSGKTKKSLYRETFDSLRILWTEDLLNDKALTYETLNPDKKGKFINYYSPVFAGHDTVIAIKTSLGKAPSFVLINQTDKTEKRIHTPGQVFPYKLTYGAGKIVWVELVSDPRWENRNYSVIKIMDKNSRIVTKISKRSRYMAASVSPDGKLIAVVENTIDNKNNFLIMSSGIGAILLSVPSPGNAYLQAPQWGGEGKTVTVISLTDDGEGIMSFNTSTQEWKTLLQPSREDIQSAVLTNDSLFFISSHSGTDNVYLQDSAKTVKRITRSRFGVSDISVSGAKAMFSDYSSSGNNVGHISLNKLPEEDEAYIRPSSYLIDRFDVETQTDDELEDREYNPQPYRKWQHLFNFHSWMPFYADLEEIQSDPTAIRPGISLMTQNHLSTIISSIGYEYSPELKHLIHSRVTWKGWYPVVESRVDYGYNPSIAKLGQEVGPPSEIQPGVKFINTVSIPLRFSSGAFTEYLRPSFTTDYRNDYIYMKETGDYDNGQTILNGRIYFSNSHRSSIRDIYPRWAQTLDLSYSYAPFDKEIYGSIFSIKTSLYFPGLLPNNGIKLRFEQEKQNTSKFLYGNRVSYPRGFKNINSEELKFMSIDYVMPLVYPDLNISSLLYLKRIRSGLFYDQASGTGNTYYKATDQGVVPDSYHDYKEDFRSMGFEILADFHVLRIPFMISGGVQAAWRYLNQPPVFEILFNIDLYGMTLGRRSI